MLTATSRIIRYNKRTECSETAYQVKVTTVTMPMRDVCYSMSMSYDSLIYDIFYFGISVPNSIAQKKTC